MASIRELTEGMKILAKYLPQGEDTHVGGAEHDIFYVCPSSAVKVSTEDEAKLDELGWHKDSQAGWAIFI